MMSNLRAIIVDDEKGAREVLQNLVLNFCEGVEVVGEFANVQDAIVGINELKPDVVFLDIEMPNYAGYEIVQFFDEIDFEIIFVTAYDNYAVKAFEVSAVDYIMKPVDIDRLVSAVDRVKTKITQEQTAKKFQVLQESLRSKKLENLIIHDKGGQSVIPLKSLIAIEAQEAYSCIHTEEKTYLVSKHLKYYEELFSDNQEMFRSHKSWIINLDKMESFQKSLGVIQMKNGVEAKLSKYKKEDFMAAIK